MDIPTYDSLLESARKNLISDFESSKDVPHYGERGEELEKVVINWLNSYLPKRYAVGTGFILGLYNEISPQTDAIIYDALNCPILRYSEKSLILPSDNVAVAIEIKSNLNKQQFDDSIEKIGKIKSISKSPITDFDLFSEGARKVAQRQTYTVLFAFDCEVSLETVSKWYVESFVNGRHIDFISILNKGWVDLFIKQQGTSDFHPVLGPEAMSKPVNAKNELELWVGYHEEPENILYFMLRNIVSHLQVFRNQIYTPAHSYSKPIKSSMKCIGTLPSSVQTEDQGPIERIHKIM